ncbi:Hypothetical Protein FCC1311_102582 [Hondaea fermentalgiana]|uniref:Uncharacterized protein n=1 Tax=Hondaea fermentalgiana TaxID=2315210 RepID=A0A2R5GTZ5_9STRA|nr:Hypothetical Protein FCC1311_102582 [Hondaea fermentalgiana]|eukprot:GBG34035.1 Hypothetical Protein FCC1311_102582 [Hondaea fermentalgiana]
MPTFKKPEERTTISRKTGETHETLNLKYRNLRLRSHGASHGPWATVSKTDFANTQHGDYKTPSKWGVISDRMAEQSRKMPKSFVGGTTYKDSMQITNDITARVYERPLREAPSVIAMRAGSIFAKNAKQQPRASGPASLVPRSLIREEKDRLAAIIKEPRVESQISRVNMPSYSGHEPKSPKNQRGPMISGPDTTSGHANLQGLGLLIA